MAETFVLVHGAWCGAWVWAGVVNQLELKGDRAYAVDLPGHGANRFDRAKVTLAVYADSVAKFIEDHGLRDVVLAGHSLGGLSIPQVATRAPSRIKRVVWVTAMVMLDGETPADPANPQNKPLLEIARSRADRSVPIQAMPEGFRAALMQDASKDLTDFTVAGLCPQPIAPLIEPVPMKRFFELGLPTSYLIAENDMLPHGIGPNWHPHFSSRLKNPTLRSVKSGHMIMMTKPVECAQALWELARS